MTILNAITTRTFYTRKSPNRKTPKSHGLVILKGCDSSKRNHFSSSVINHCCLTLVWPTAIAKRHSKHECHHCSHPAAPATVAIITVGALTWSQLFAHTKQIIAKPVVEFGVLVASLFMSAEAPEVLLAKLEAQAWLLPVMIAMVSDEEPDQITILKNPRCFARSLTTPSPIETHLWVCRIQHL